MEPVHRKKAFAVITRESTIGLEVVVLLHPDHPGAGIQLPAGTIRAEEDVVAAALREAREETGLQALRFERVLGEADFDARPWGRDEIHHRTFVHLSCHEPTASTWEHWEEDPDGSPGERFRFELRWVPLDSTLPQLIGDHGVGLHLLETSLDTSTGT
jgi:8-oxo-dGTP diphosphatase